MGAYILLYQEIVAGAMPISGLIRWKRGSDRSREDRTGYRMKPLADAIVCL